MTFYNEYLKIRIQSDVEADTVGWQPKNQKLVPDVEAGNRWLATEKPEIIPDMRAGSWLATEKPETYTRHESWKLTGNGKTRNYIY